MGDSDHRGRIVSITMGREYKPGDPPPQGYLAWHEWAEVQHRAGLRQTLCPDCTRWTWPQEFSDKRICTECAQRKEADNDQQQ